MLKIKIFPIEKFDEANTFLEKFAARTERGLTITPDGKSIGVFYEEGEQSKAELVADLRVQLQTKQREAQVTDKNKRIALKRLKLILPEGLEGASDEVLAKHFQEEKGFSPKMAKQTVAGIAEARNAMLMALENGFHTQVETEVLQEMIAELETGESKEDPRDSAIIKNKALESVGENVTKKGKK